MTDDERTYGDPNSDSGPDPAPPPYPAPQPEAPQYGSPQYATPQYAPPQYGYPGAQPATPPPGAAGDVLAAGTVERRHRRIAPVVISVVAVVAVVAAGGAFAAHRLLASSGSQPDTLAPASSIEFAEVDLDPAASEKLDIWRFEQHFPSAPKVASADALKDALLEQVFAADSTLDYNTDIKPWLGDRVAVAVFVDSTGQEQPIGIVQVKDDAKARAALRNAASQGFGGSADDTLQPQQFGYTITDGYAVIGASQAAVDDAVKQAKQSSIRDNTTYTDDVATLGGNRVVTAWVDEGALMKVALQSLGGGAASLGMLGIPSTGIKGRVVVGVTVQPDAVDLEARMLGASQTVEPKAGTAGQALGQLPSGSVAGFALSNPESYLKTLLAQVSSSPLLAQGMQSEFDQLGLEYGIKLPDDVYNLVGSELVVGLDSLPDPGGQGAALVTVRTKPDDAAKALATAQQLAGLASQDGFPLTVSGGDHIVATNDPNPAGGALADDATYKAAMSGMPAQVSVAGYVDLGAIATLDPVTSADAQHLGGLGFYATTDSTSPIVHARLTVK